MPDYKYLIVGGGMTADAAVGGIRQVDAEGSIGLVSADSHRPYDRPPLSKGLWKGKAQDSIWRKAAAQHATLHLERRIVALDPANKCATDDRGDVYHYEKLLLATGGTPRRLAADHQSIIYYRTFDDYRRLSLLAGEKRRFAVIGGGLIGSELAAALAMNGREVVMIFPDQGICGRMFPADLARFLNDFYRRKGVDVQPGQKVVDVENRGDKFILKTRSIDDAHEQRIEADAVVAGLGIQPNVELAQQAGLAVGNGICVDSALRASYPASKGDSPIFVDTKIGTFPHPDVYAAGDVAEFFNPALAKRIRVEHEDNANSMGEAAGKSMAGEPVTYDHLPFFYSDLFELGYEAVGDLDSRLETLVQWKEPYREGVVCYLEKGRVRGVLLWNVWEQVDAARGLIAQAGPFRPEELKTRLLEMHQLV